MQSVYFAAPADWAMVAADDFDGAWVVAATVDIVVAFAAAVTDALTLVVLAGHVAGGAAGWLVDGSKGGWAPFVGLRTVQLWRSIQSCSVEGGFKDLGSGGKRDEAIRLMRGG